jgi:ubiquinone/menaquinone biosynthesis C-methylase UbiE
MSTGRAPYPDAAAAWMVTDDRSRVLDLGSGSGRFAAMLHRAGHEVFCLDRAVDRVAGLPDRLGTHLHVAGRVESLPFLSCNFDVVTAAATLHRFTPGLALTEIGRVLRPGGRFAVAYNTRDDTVPWVRRLTALLQQNDPEAMRGDYGIESLSDVTDSPYFTELVRRDFRNWVPITRKGLVSMVERRPSMTRLDPTSRQALLDEVAALYDSIARPPEPLLLPYRASCWRAEVDHTGLVLGEDDLDVVQIRL